MNKKSHPTAFSTTSSFNKTKVRLKVCGMKYRDNIQQVAALQPDYIGFIFYQKSARYFNSKSIPEIANTIKKTGVFVNASLNFIINKIKAHHLQAVQLHGNESAHYCLELKQRYKETSTSISNEYNSLEIIKVFSVNNTFDFNVLKPYEPVSDYFLFDTKGEQPGGNGYTFNWDVLNNYPSTKPFFLSGGIGVEEIEKIKQFQKSEASKYCYAIDVNSKFEIEPGLKNMELLKKFTNLLTFCSLIMLPVL